MVERAKAGTRRKHDREVECCTLQRTEKGIDFDETFSLDEI